MLNHASSALADTFTPSMEGEEKPARCCHVTFRIGSSLPQTDTAELFLCWCLKIDLLFKSSRLFLCFQSVFITPQPQEEKQNGILLPESPANRHEPPAVAKAQPQAPGSSQNRAFVFQSALSHTVRCTGFSVCSVESLERSGLDCVVGYVSLSSLLDSFVPVPKCSSNSVR